ncbi:MAG: FtsX-like permease family protein, partial [Synergistales bacterium]|nr:FtsX-like permease family protein [Synergistales bacterium]
LQGTPEKANELRESQSVNFCHQTNLPCVNPAAPVLRYSVAGHITDVQEWDESDFAKYLINDGTEMYEVNALGQIRRTGVNATRYGDQWKAVALLGQNPLPWSLEIQVHRVEHITPLVRDLVVFPSVEEVLYSGKLVERLSTISRASSAISAGILILTIAISALVIFNTIRIAIYSRKEEIEVMLLIGATKTYISLPFVFQGMFLGAGGALLAVAGLWATYASAVNAVRSTLAFLDIIVNQQILLQFFLLLFATGATMGWMCSWLAVSRFTSRALRPR